MRMRIPNEMNDWLLRGKDLIGCTKAEYIRRCLSNYIKDDVKFAQNVQGCTSSNSQTIEIKKGLDQFDLGDNPQKTIRDAIAHCMGFVEHKSTNVDVENATYYDENGTLKWQK